MNSQSILNYELELIKTELIQKYDQLGMRASGKWEESLEVAGKKAGPSISRFTSGAILGEPYTEQLVNGRGPTSSASASSPTLREVIEQWIYDKGIKPIEAKMKISTLAFLIARKIHREGTQYFKQGGTDLVESVITPARIQKIIDKVSEFHINRFTTELTNQFQKMAA